MKRILCSDWLPEQARWPYLALPVFPRRSRKKKFSFGHIINPLLTKLGWSRWLDIGLVLFCVFIDLDFVSVHKNAKKTGLRQYPFILTLHLSITHIYRSRARRPPGNHWAYREGHLEQF